MKICTKCGKRRSLRFFYKDSQKSTGLRPDCKTCSNIKSLHWSKNNPEKRRAIMRKFEYGISGEEYETMLQKQKSLCKICRKSDSKHLGVDHDHTTGKIRGLLCQRCNAGLGMFLDEIASLKRAIRYLGGSL